MNKETDRMVRGVKVKRTSKYITGNWLDECNSAGLNPLEELTVMYEEGNGLKFNELLTTNNYTWSKGYFEIVEDSIEEPKSVNDTTELEDLLKQIKISLKVTEDARKAYEAAKAKSLELNHKLQVKMKNI